MQLCLGFHSRFGFPELRVLLSQLADPLLSRIGPSVCPLQSFFEHVHSGPERVDCPGFPDFGPGVSGFALLGVSAAFSHAPRGTLICRGSAGWFGGSVIQPARFTFTRAALGAPKPKRAAISLYVASTKSGGSSSMKRSLSGGSVSDDSEPLQRFAGQSQLRWHCHLPDIGLIGSLQSHAPQTTRAFDPREADRPHQAGAVSHGAQAPAGPEPGAI
jgi:hypothetical protein